MVDAMELWQRTPDRESGWLHVKAAWPDIMRFPWRVGVGGEHDEREAVTVPKRPNPSREQIAKMVEASEWLLLAPERDRKLVAIVLAHHVRRPGKPVRWIRIWDGLGRGRPGPDGLRMRYSRAIGDIARALSGEKPGSEAFERAQKMALSDAQAFEIAGGKTCQVNGE